MKIRRDPMQSIDFLLGRLSTSKFRSRFHLKKKDIEYIESVGLDKIKSHAYDFISKRLAPKIIDNDGKQTPYHGHPVFISEHATATCCRACLYKWHKIEKNKALTSQEIDYVVEIIMRWIEIEYVKGKRAYEEMSLGQYK